METQTKLEHEVSLRWLPLFALPSILWGIRLRGSQHGQPPNWGIWSRCGMWSVCGRNSMTRPVRSMRHNTKSAPEPCRLRGSFLFL